MEAVGIKILTINIANGKTKIFEGFRGILSFGIFKSHLSFLYAELNKKVKITDIASAIEKEPLIQPFGFKGGYLTELWRSIARLTSSNGQKAIGLGTQSVL